MMQLSLWQPWATAMDRAAKKNETRGWSTTYRGDVLICASKRPPKGDDEFGGDVEELYRSAVFLPYCPEQERSSHGVRWRYNWGAMLPYGAALCVVELYDVVPITQAVVDVLTPTEYYLGNYAAGRFAWKTRNLRRLAHPMAWRGSQGLRQVPPEAVKRIKAQLVRTCQGCGCTEAHACPGGCAWSPSNPDRCTSCDPDRTR